jgi:type I restriction enzyme, S subunit
MSSKNGLVNLNDIVDILGDGLHGTPKFSEDGDYYFINGNNLSDGNIIIKDNTKKVKEEEYIKHKKDLNDRTILVSINGTLGNVATYKGEKVILGKSACYFNVKSEVNMDYVKYVVINKHFQEYIQRLSTGTTIKNVSLKTMREYQFYLPNITVQNQIVSILNPIDNKIQLNRKAISNIEEISQTLFKRWFIDFEFPNEEEMPYISSGGKMVESELGEIPEGWRVRKLGDIYTNHDSKRKPLSKMERSKREKIYPYYGAISLVDYVDDYKYDGKFILLSEDGANVLTPEGAPSLQYVWGKFWVNNHAHVMTGTKNISTEFIFNLLKQLNFTSIVTGAVQPKISQSNLNAFKVIVPEDELIKKYDEIIQPLTEQFIEFTNQINSLEKLRDSLLPKLLSGEIERPDESVVV